MNIRFVGRMFEARMPSKQILIKKKRKQFQAFAKWQGLILLPKRNVVNLF